MSAHVPVNLIERRREALLIASRLQRRNVAARWRQLHANRVVGWAESAKALADAIGGPSGMRRAAAGSIATLASSALWAVRERSGWGVLALMMKWWLRRREKRRVREQLADAERERRHGLGRRRGLFFSRHR